MRALYYSIIASTFGSFVGLVVLMFFAPILSAISVKFGPPELMLLAICGLSIVGSLTGKNVSKGLLAALIGLFLAMVGVDEATGSFRFTFGSKALLGGVDLIPAVIGLFAITEMVKQGMEQMQESKNTEKLKLIPAKFSEALKNTFGKYLSILLRSSVLGTFIGILPGTGGAIASFLAYGDAKSGDKEGTFGTGNPAGIIAPESANNAAVGGSLVPMLSLGIPGSATSAIMFGALTIHGLVPGQRLFVDHADIVYTFMVGMFVVTFFMFLIGVIGIPIFSHILKLKMKHIIPVVILFSLIGAFSVNNSINDVFIAISLGVLGVVFARLEIPNTPIVLGLILGNIVESNFIRSSVIVKAQGTSFFTYVLTRPLCIGILLLTAYLIWANIRAIRRGTIIRKASNIQQDIYEE